jgi:ABC-type thiamine transport system ATPase subunit
MAKLEPPEGGTFLDGLEVRVAFGSVWKQSLSELSGGQRSLLALSLILALLLFKPAPLYILDEVILTCCSICKLYLLNLCQFLLLRMNWEINLGNKEDNGKYLY